MRADTDDSLLLAEGSAFLGGFGDDLAPETAGSRVQRLTLGAAFLPAIRLAQAQTGFWGLQQLTLGSCIPT